jgi:hypothetical protein
VVKRGIYLEARGGKHPMPGAQPYDTWPDGTPRYRRMDLGYHPELDQRVNSDYVDEQGRQGAPELRNVFMEVPLNTRCEVTDIEPLLKYAHIITPVNQASYLEPQTMEGWVKYTDLLPLPDANSPFIRRRGSQSMMYHVSADGGHEQTGFNEQGMYLFDSIDEAISFGNGWLEKKPNKYLYSVAILDPSLLQPDDEWEALEEEPNEHAFYYQGPIPPENVRLIDAKTRPDYWKPEDYQRLTGQPMAEANWVDEPPKTR